ncbi:MAG: hypothetical protein ACTH2Q_09010 [Propionibacteriaceae bacterium]
MAGEAISPIEDPVIGGAVLSDPDGTYKISLPVGTFILLVGCAAPISGDPSLDARVEVQVRDQQETVADIEVSR